MELPDFTQLGFGLSALALIWVVVKYFIETVNRKDAQIQELITNFNTTINNHINHETEQAKQQTEAINNLAKVISGLAKQMNKK